MRERSKLPTSQLIRKPTPFWRYQLKPGRHLVHWKLLTPSVPAELHLTDVVIYSDKALTLDVAKEKNRYF